jgi:hypothetical protein
MADPSGLETTYDLGCLLCGQNASGYRILLYEGPHGASPAKAGAGARTGVDSWTVFVMGM